MTNYIESSKTIQEFLDEEKIEIEVDEYAPVVLCTAPHGEWLVHLKPTELSEYRPEEYRCPFFGPGGEGNLLKALRAWGKKKGYVLESPTYYKDIAWAIWQGEPHCRFNRCLFTGKGKTDGITLADLLYKIATEEK
jgi:hypothetical protein